MRIAWVLAIGLGSSALAGCSPFNQDRITGGALVGGASGAAIGGAVAGTLGAGLVGGAVGAIAGAAIADTTSPKPCAYRNRLGEIWYRAC
jgi:hypothetical protein